jgi:hypothetical protein
LQVWPAPQSPGVQPVHVPVAPSHVGAGAAQSALVTHSRQSPEGTWQIGFVPPHSFDDTQPRHVPADGSQTGVVPPQSPFETQPTQTPEGT